jgi:hypothetical protein
VTLFEKQPLIIMNLKDITFSPEKSIEKSKKILIEIEKALKNNKNIVPKREYGVRDEYLIFQNNKEIMKNQPQFVKSKFFKENSYAKYKIEKNPSYRDVYKFVDGTNYHIGTNAKFTPIEIGDLECKKEWDKLIKKYGKDKQSPLSNSKYIVTKNGVYRLADHWGRCASCEWNIPNDNDSKIDRIGYANFSEFTINTNAWNWTTIAPDYFKLLNDNLLIDMERILFVVKNISINDSLKKMYFKKASLLLSEIESNSIEFIKNKPFIFKEIAKK